VIQSNASSNSRFRGRVNRIQVLEIGEAPDLPTHGRRFSLSLRERAGVRGKGRVNFEACANFEMPPNTPGYFLAFTRPDLMAFRSCP